MENRILGLKIHHDNCNTVEDVILHESEDNYCSIGFIGETIIFTVFDQDGNNVSASSDFYVNETKIPSNTHTFNSIGTFDVYAKHGQLTSVTKTIEIRDSDYELASNSTNMTKIF